MTIEALLDVNVVIAAILEDHEHHGIAKPFVESLERFYTCPTTQGGFLRFATRGLPGFTFSIHQAQTKLREFTSLDGHVFVPDDQTFDSLQTARIQGHRQWTDAYLLKLAQCRNIKFASIDARARGLDSGQTFHCLVPAR